MIPRDVHHGPPSDDAVQNATLHRVASIDELDPRDSVGIRALIDEGRPVTVSVRVYQNWWGAVTKQTGKTPVPLPLSLRDGPENVALPAHCLARLRSPPRPLRRV